MKILIYIMKLMIKIGIVMFCFPFVLMLIPLMFFFSMFTSCMSQAFGITTERSHRRRIKYI